MKKIWQKLITMLLALALICPGVLGALPSMDVLAAAETMAHLGAGEPNVKTEDSKDSEETEEGEMDAADYVVETEKGYDIYSPDKMLHTSIYLNENKELSYTVERNGKVFVPESELGMTIDNVDYGKDPAFAGVRAAHMIDRTYEIQGKKKTGRDHCVQVELDMEGPTGITYVLKVRAYGDGIAFAYDFSGLSSNSHIVKENTQFMVPKGSVTWGGVDREHYANYESLVEKMDPETTIKDENGTDAGINMAMTAEFPNKEGYTAILEGNANTTYVGSALRAEGGCSYRIQTNWSTTVDTVSISGGFYTPWRIVSVADDLNELVNNMIVYSVNDEKSDELFADQDEWVIPGRSAWSWLNGGVSKVTPDNMRHYTELAAKLGFEYNTIDEGWVFWNNGDKTNYDQELYKDKLASVAEYGEEYNVRQFLWSCINNMTGNMPGMSGFEDVETYLDLMEETGMAGGKIDFWPNESFTSSMKLYRQTLEKAAEKKLLINFHGSMKPTGWEAAYPNEVTREAIRGYEQVNYDENSRGMEFAPYTYYTTQPFTRYLQGHADFTPHVRSAGEIAALIFGDSPVNMISTDPEEILASDTLEMIKSIPTIWDQTYVLPQSKIGEMTAYAREKDKTWFVGAVADQKDQTITVDFSEFLDDGDYFLEMWKDTAVMDSNGNGGSKEKTSEIVNKDTKMEVKVLEHGGFVMRLTKLSLSQYGGEIKENTPLVITTPSKDSVVKVTFDGTDPMISSTAEVYDGPITLKESCKVRVAIVSGDGKGTSVSHQFNKIVEGKTERANIEDALKDAKACREDRYTKDSYEVLKASIEKAETILKSEEATVEELDAVYDTLVSALENLMAATMEGLYRPSEIMEQSVISVEDGTAIENSNAPTDAKGTLGGNFDNLSGSREGYLMVDKSATPLFNGILEGSFKADQCSKKDPVGFAFRVRDSKNFCTVQFDGENWTLVQKVEGKTKTFANQLSEKTTGFDKAEDIRILYVEGKIQVYVNYKIQASFVDEKIYTGAGSYGVLASKGEALLENICYYDHQYFQTDMAEGSDYDIEMTYTATAGNEQSSEPAQRVLDGDASTLWHTNWNGCDREDMYITFDLQGSKEVAGLRYLPRSSGGMNGVITRYAIELSDDGGKTFTRVTEGIWDLDSLWKKAVFPAQNATHVRLVSLESESEKEGVEFTSAAEIRITQKRKDSASDDTYDIPVSAIKILAGSAQSGEGPERALDGDIDTLWHSSWNGSEREDLYVVFELNEIQKVDGLRYLPRQSGQNGLVTKYKVQVSLDGETYTDVAEGDWTADTAWKRAAFEAVDAKYVKFLVLDAGTDSSGKFFASAAEMRLTGHEEGPEEPDPEPEKISIEVLEYALEIAKTVDTDGVIPTVVEKFQIAYENAQSIFDKVNAADTSVTQEMVDDAWKELIMAMQYLSFKQGDKEDLQKVVAMAEGIDLTKYLQEGQKNFGSSLTMAKEVLEDGDAMQADVDNAWKALLKAMSELRLKPDKTALEIMIREAQKIDTSDINERDVEILKSALAVATNVMADEEATEEEVATAEETLKTAVTTIVASVKVAESTSLVQSSADDKVDNAGKTETLKSAKTGDNAGIMVLITLMVGAALVVTGIKSKKVR